MVDTAPKISFIPKAPLVREEYALRARPRSVLAVIAFITFIVSTGAYLGLFLYHRALASDVNNVTTEIEKLQKDFDRPEVNEARAFRVRADLANTLLSQHATMRPIFAFLERYTIEKIFYTDFSYMREGVGGPSLELKGEAPDYASLAYQMDTFRDKKELSSFSIQDLTLTRTGTVTFSLSLVFTPELLLYAGYISEAASLSGEQIENPSTGEVVATSSPSTATTSLAMVSENNTKEEVRGEVVCEAPLERVVQEDGTVMCVDGGSSQSTTTETFKSFWSWLKFW